MQFLLGLILGSVVVTVGLMLKQQRLLNRLLDKDQEIVQLGQSLNFQLSQQQEAKEQVEKLKTDYQNLLNSKDQQLLDKDQEIAQLKQSLNLQLTQGQEANEQVRMLKADYQNLLNKLLVI